MRAPYTSRLAYERGGLRDLQAILWSLHAHTLLLRLGRAAWATNTRGHRVGWGSSLLACVSQHKRKGGIKGPKVLRDSRRRRQSLRERSRALWQTGVEMFI